MKPSAIKMPDGKPFEFWDDTTRYRRTYHVAQEHPAASDEGRGTEERPFATIGRAAALLQAGEKVVVHRGIYRECVRPARGGEGASRMIAYEAAPGDKVVVRGSESWRPTFRPGEGWNFGALPKGAAVWTGDLPAEWFTGYNPFAVQNFSSEFTTFTRDWTTEELQVFLRYRGMVFADGRPLRQVLRPADLAAAEGAFWVEAPGLRLHLRLWDGMDPARTEFEVTTREQVFAPLTPGLGFIRVSGFVFEYAADGIPVPQRAMVSAARGHHWIVEDNVMRWANSCGLDVGNETWHRPSCDAGGKPSGHHIIRRNRVSDCGACGMAAVSNNAGTLVEANIIERVGGLNIERIWETGGLKFHVCDTVLIRGNVFRHLRSAPGLWLDYLNLNCRITRNVFADIESLNGGVYLEVSHAANTIDHNVFWDIRGPRAGTGHAINIDSGELCLAAHNFIGKIRDGYGVSAHLGQKERVVGGRVGLCRRHRVLNNIFWQSPHRVYFARTGENVSDGNLFDDRDDATSLCIEFPEPKALLNLSAWQEYYGFDVNGRQLRIEADFDPERLTLSVEIHGKPSACRPIAGLDAAKGTLSPGPLPFGAKCHMWHGDQILGVRPASWSNRTGERKEEERG